MICCKKVDIGFNIILGHVVTFTKRCAFEKQLGITVGPSYLRKKHISPFLAFDKIIIFE